VGGMVRDVVLGRMSTDLDVVIEGDAAGVAKDYARAVGGAAGSVTAFGTSKVSGGPAGVVDFAATRTESYRRPGALPEVKVVTSVEEDLARRDFTINAMAMHISPRRYGDLLDPFDGLGDIGRGVLRVLHEQSFADDATRVLRGIRFCARYGYRFEQRTRRILNASLDAGCMATISGKRVRRELELIFTEENAAAGIRLLDRYGILGSIYEGLSLSPLKRKRLATAARALRSFTQWTGAGEVDARAFWFAYLFIGLEPGSVAFLIQHLNLDRRLRKTCRFVYPALFYNWVALRLLERPYAFKVTVLLRDQTLEALALLHCASDRRERRMVEMYVREWRHVKPLVRGSDLVALGVKPGPAVGRMLDRILDLKLRGKLPTRRSELAFARAEADGVRS
jgi:tRNA nucleotidyltransferase (CCA-adding enzyme)